MAASNRRDFLLDTVLGAILTGINATTNQVALSKVFVEPDNVQSRNLPRVSYHLLDDRKNYVGANKRIQQSNPQGFVIFAYCYTAVDSSETALLATEVNRVIDLVEKIFENDKTQYGYTDTNGTITVDTTKIEDVVPVIDDTRQTGVIQFTGVITYSKFLT